MVTRRRLIIGNIKARSKLRTITITVETQTINDNQSMNNQQTFWFLLARRTRCSSTSFRNALLSFFPVALFCTFVKSTILNCCTFCLGLLCCSLFSGCLSLSNVYSPSSFWILDPSSLPSWWSTFLITAKSESSSEKMVGIRLLNALGVSKSSSPSTCKFSSPLSDSTVTLLFGLG